MKNIYAFIFIAFLLLSADAGAQVFPYFEAFDMYTPGQPLNGNGGLTSTGRVLVTPHGIAGNCAEFQMNAAGNDTINSPSIGPLTSHSAASFYFRVIKYVGGVATRYALTGTDNAEIYIADPSFTFVYPQFAINSSTQNPDTNYIKIVVPAPGFVNGYPGKFRIVASNTSGNSWLLQMDSFAVRDTFLTPPVLTSSVISDSCRGDSTGSIFVLATGATAPYAYTWSTGDTTIAIGHLAAGIYSVTVTDALGATASRSDTVRAPRYQLLLDSVTHRNLACYGIPTGVAGIYPAGGTPAYTYRWSTTPPQSTQQVQGLPAGTYAVTVSDANGCSVSAITQITQPPALVLSVSSTSTTGNTGTATAIVNGGTSPFSYLWTPSGQTAAIATHLDAGIYTVVVTDANGCTISDSARVLYAVGIDDVERTSLRVYPLPASSVLYFSVDGHPLSNAAVTIADMSGRVVEALTANDGRITIAHLADGMYILSALSGGQQYMTRFSVHR